MDLLACAEKIQRLDAALEAMIPEGEFVGVPSPAGEEWWRLLRHKLLPQLCTEPRLVVAIIGGTNIGKSLIFNHLAGAVASTVSPLAARTKHPVCLVPPDSTDLGLLERLFEGFQLRPWQSADDALTETSEHLLFWRLSQSVSPRLLLLDTPDVDSDMPINWERARRIRQVADVLIAVLTQQKYNDAAVKQFFREAAQADKPVVVLFNQCDMESDWEYWPVWLETFCRETGVDPLWVYVVPRDRVLAEQLRLPFYEVGRDGRCPEPRPADLREELATLHFDRIKIRTLRGALRRVVDSSKGLGGYLEAVRQKVQQFQEAYQVLEADTIVQTDWPPLPPKLFKEQISAWWDERRARWVRTVHHTYQKIVHHISQKGREILSRWIPPLQSKETPVAPCEEFHQEEKETIIRSVEAVYQKLEQWAEVGNEVLRPRIHRLLGGQDREALFDKLHQDYQSLPAVNEEFRRFLWEKLDDWQKQHPWVVKWLRTGDMLFALGRPAITVSLCFSGWTLAGNVVGQLAGNSAIAMIADTVGATAVAGTGEAILTTAGKGTNQLVSRYFLSLQTSYVQQRQQWLIDWLRQALLAPLLDELRHGAQLPQSPPFVQIQQLCQELLDALEVMAQPADVPSPSLSFVEAKIAEVPRLPWGQEDS